DVQADVARELHLAVGEQLTAEVGHRAEHAREAEHTRQQFVLEHAVLHGQAVVDLHVAQRLERGAGFDGLGGDDERAGLVQLAGIVYHRGPCLDVGQAVEHQALALQDARALAAHDHRDLVSGPRQVCAEDGTERSRAEDGKSHSPPVDAAPGRFRYFFRYLSNHARMLSTLAMRLLGRATIPPCEASGMRTITVSTWRSLSAW